MNNINLNVTISNCGTLTANQAAVILNTLINAGRSYTYATICNGEGDLKAAELATSIHIHQPVPVTSSADAFLRQVADLEIWGYDKDNGDPYEEMESPSEGFSDSHSCLMNLIEQARKELIDKPEETQPTTTDVFAGYFGYEGTVNKAPRGKPRGINCALQAAGFQPAFRPKGRGIDPVEIKINFSAPTGASVAVKDAAFLAALAQQADINYLVVGSTVTPEVVADGAMSDAEYVAQGGGICPVCHSSEIDGGSHEVDGPSATQEVGCNDCNSSWKDQYKLIGYSDLVRE